jgi:hypothetical protein
MDHSILHEECPVPSIQHFPAITDETRENIITKTSDVVTTRENIDLSDSTKRRRGQIEALLELIVSYRLKEYTICILKIVYLHLQANLLLIQVKF